MKIATWNVNSIRARQERVLAWLAAEQPDVFCLQELKVADEEFEGAPYEELGYQMALHGQRTYNGVAILAKEPIVDVARTLADEDDDPQARLIAGTVRGVRVVSVYCPNGGEVGSDKWIYKLRWFERLHGWLGRHADPDAPLALCGDYNVAPDDKDVKNPDLWAATTLCHPDARAAVARLSDWGLFDVVRHHNPEGGIYSWWDYRMLGFPKNDGLRIDHVFATRGLAERSRSAGIDRNARKGQRPSDHAPVWAVFE